MQKALLMASVIIGDFLFQPANAQVDGEGGRLGEDNPAMCPFGGNYSPVLGFCFVPATDKQQFQAIYQDQIIATDESVDGLSSKIKAHFESIFFPNHPSRVDKNPSNQSCTRSYSAPFSEFTFTDRTSTSPPRVTGSFSVKQNITQNGCSSWSGPSGPNSTVYSMTYTIPVNIIEGPVCPPESSNPNFYVFSSGPYETTEGYNICYYPAATPDNDDGEDCPPDTIGDCDIPDEPQCSIGGNGMEVCEADPNEKCASYEHEGKTFYDCPAGCGFIQDKLFCTTEPDSDGEIPDMSKCFKVATGWACPPDSPTPDDNIDNPEKPLPDMTKGDFKETNKGVETRLDATNSLLGDIAGTGKATNQGIADLNAKALAANGILSQIRQNTGATAGNTKDILDLLKENSEAEPLELDNDWKSVFSAGLGITGDETIDDLTKSEITLDQFKSEFQWSSSSSQCPQPRAINILSKTFYMDWQPFCSAFNVLGYFILAAAYFLSIRIAFGGRT